MNVCVKVERYKSMSSRSNHMKKCPFNTKSPRKVFNYKIGKDGTTKSKCKFCPKYYSSKQGAYRHQKVCNSARVKSGKQPITKKRKQSKFNCETCFKKFDRADKLETHKKIHTGENRKTCSKCTRTFKRIDF